MAAVMWCSISAGLALGSVLMCGVGLFFFPVCSYTYRFLAKIQVELTKVFCPHEDPTKMVMMEPVWFCNNFFKGNWCNPLTWKSLGFFLFVQSFWASFTFAVQLAMLYVSLGALSLPILFATQTNAAAGCDKCVFLIANGWATFLLIPIGLILFYLTCVITSAMAEAERSISWACLSSRIIDSRHFAQLTCVQGERTGLTTQVGDAPTLVSLPENPAICATPAKADIPTAYMHQYARKSRGNVCLTILCCFCCLLVTVGIATGVAFSLIAARCNLAARSSHSELYTYDLTKMGTTTQIGVVDMDDIVSSGTVNFFQNASESKIVRTSVRYEWVPLKDGDSWDEYYNPSQSEGLVNLGDFSIDSSWKRALLCTRVYVNVTLPANVNMTTLTGRGSLVVNMANADIDFNAALVDASTFEPFTEIQLKTTNGHIEMGDFATYDSPLQAGLALQTTNGHIEMHNVFVNGSLTASTTNGHIEANKLGAVYANLVTNNGHVEIDSMPLYIRTDYYSSDYTGVTAETNNGHITLGTVYLNSSTSQQVQANTNNGAVDVTTSGFQGNFDLYSNNGKITVQAGAVTYQQNDNNDKQGTIGSGRNSVNLQTWNGKIQWLAL
eukprot:NODE_216_length_2287_cov_148.243519_g210_i0.p1 GENE.NODE_216_length_2287_cov_148.243519_g210_i0~~NODE_216_length_2287_cov_148.243519_g210_i0.p1  ORF type:complete len:717 (-),score=183.47 NODE_216_length_2287_cov_148.243519_g210_i0:135-1967(-)